MKLRRGVLVISGVVIGSIVAAIAMVWLWFNVIDPHGRARSAVRHELVDPDSAKFRNLRRVEFGTCGEVNMKNRLVGYVGFKPFHVIIYSEYFWKVTYDKARIDRYCE